jgi:hypothetical protein
MADGRWLVRLDSIGNGVTGATPFDDGTNDSPTANNQPTTTLLERLLFYATDPLFKIRA